MHRILDLRITRWPIKLAYIVVVCLIRYPFLALLSAVGLHPLAVNIIDSIVLLAVIFLATRIFRGAGEPVTPARPWWQMTAWPKLSRRLGILLLVGTAFTLVFVVLTVTGVIEESASNRLTLGEWIASLVFNVIVCAFYLNSAIRQTRGGVTRPVSPAAPTFKPWSKLG
ncbi:hypothetical protein QCD70_15505 [Agreia sp. PsM10]|uniref:hypothetical protein n=1 Tax=Agreia sp. PsM10 TaxID=3030533 RepID=UPI00263B531C|nr:hypothetical protein [Agreia sp. PsM10]MDN4641658.1 hypothetical protein [Agreia sp. PsM10]